MTVATLVAKLRKLPQGAQVVFLDTDDVYRAAAVVEDAQTVDAFERSLQHPDSASVLRDAGIRRGQVLVLGCTK